MKILLKFLLLSTAAIFLISCGGSGGGGKNPEVAVVPAISEYYFEGKLNGVLTRFNGYVFTQRYLESQSKEIGITGWVGERSSPNGAFGIQLGQYISGIALAPTTYQYTVGSQLSSPIIASYVRANENLFYSSVTQNFTVNITELNGTFVKGTFTGRIENLNNKNNNDVISVTEGRFYAPHCTFNC